MQRLGRTGPIRPAETKSGAIRAQIAAFRTVHIARRTTQEGTEPDSASASHSRIASTAERAVRPRWRPARRQAQRRSLRVRALARLPFEPSASRAAFPPAPCGRNPSRHGRRAADCSPAVRQGRSGCFRSASPHATALGSRRVRSALRRSIRSWSQIDVRIIHRTGRACWCALLRQTGGEPTGTAANWPKPVIQDRSGFSRMLYCNFNGEGSFSPSAHARLDLQPLAIPMASPSLRDADS